MVLSYGFLKRGPEYVFFLLSLTRVACVQAPSWLVFLTLPGLITLDVRCEGLPRFGIYAGVFYRCSGLLLESYAACWSAKPLSSQYSSKRHNTVSACVAKYAGALSPEAVNTAHSLKYWLWVARFFVFFFTTVHIFNSF